MTTNHSEIIKSTSITSQLSLLQPGRRRRHAPLKEIASHLKNSSFSLGPAVSCIIGAALIVFLGAGCRGPRGATALDQMPVQRPVSLSAGDVVKLTFPGAPDLNQSQKIRTDGKINLPLIGEVDAAGQTIADLQGKLSLLYKPQLQNTTVVVTLESSTIPVVISGAVKKPGKILFERPTTVLQAIMEAGGTTEFGNLRKVQVIRLAHGQQQTQILDVKSALSGKTTRAFYVRDGDVIYVPESPF